MPRGLASKPTMCGKRRSKSCYISMCWHNLDNRSRGGPGSEYIELHWRADTPLPTPAYIACDAGETERSNFRHDRRRLWGLMFVYLGRRYPEETRPNGWVVQTCGHVVISRYRFLSITGASYYGIIPGRYRKLSSHCDSPQQYKRHRSRYVGIVTVCTPMQRYRSETPKPTTCFAHPRMEPR